MFVHLNCLLIQGANAVVWEHLGVACNLLCIFCLFVFQSAEVG